MLAAHLQPTAHNARGCPWAPKGAPCWVADQVYTVAWAIKNDWPVTQNYNLSHTNRWVSLKVSHTNMRFEGVMTECNVGTDEYPAGSCRVYDPLVDGPCTLPISQCPNHAENSPRAAWNQLWDQMQAYDVGQSTLNYITNIHYISNGP